MLLMSVREKNRKNIRSRDTMLLYIWHTYSTWRRNQGWNYMISLVENCKNFHSSSKYSPQVCAKRWSSDHIAGRLVLESKIASFQNWIALWQRHLLDTYTNKKFPKFQFKVTKTQKEIQVFLCKVSFGLQYILYINHKYYGHINQW